MKKTLNNLVIALRISVITFIMVLLCLVLLSFSYSIKYNDFLKQLGISKPDAELKITQGLLNASIDTYGMRNVKNILLNNRVALVKDIAGYAKKHVHSESFRNEYALLRQNNKPSPMAKVETPEEMRANMIKSAKEGVVQAELLIKKAPDNMKDLFKSALTSSQKSLKEAEDPNNKYAKAYAKNYASVKASTQERYDASIKEWELKYPVNALTYIKPNLELFLKETGEIDFEAQLVEKKGVKYFVNPIYERKSDRWKMAYRAGKPAVETARALAQQWLNEIN